VFKSNTFEVVAHAGGAMGSTLNYSLNQCHRGLSTASQVILCGRKALIFFDHHFTGFPDLYNFGFAVEKEHRSCRVRQFSWFR